MALENENGGNGFYMPVAPAYAGNGGFGGGFGGDWGWIILLLLACGGGWGMGGFGGGFGAMMGGLGYDFPWLLNGQNQINANTNGNFRDAMLNDGITSIRDGISGISTQLCSGFAGTTAAVTGAQNAISAQLYSDTIANLERSYAAQTASTAGMSAIQSQLAQCCCDNRLATAQTQALVQSENCADRYEAAQNTAAIINAITGGIQAIKDDLCADRLDAERRENQNLRTQLSMAQLSASQNAQTAAIIANNEAQTSALEQYLAPVPRPAYVVQNPNCCAATTCGCGVA